VTDDSQTVIRPQAPRGPLTYLSSQTHTHTTQPKECNNPSFIFYTILRRLINTMKLTGALSFLLLASASAFAPSSSSNTRSSTSLSMSQVVRNPNFGKLVGGYLFPEIGRRRNAYIEENPEMASKIISLGIGDTTQPIPDHILSGLVNSASKLGTKEGYSGYGAEQGMGDLRAKIADKLYNGIIKDSEVFVSDGAKCDIMRVQQVFGSGVVTAVQVSKLSISFQDNVKMKNKQHN